MPKLKPAETETIPGVLAGDEEKYAAATPEQRARYHAAVEELRVLLNEAEAGAEKVIAEGGRLMTHDEAFAFAKAEAKKRLRRDGIIGPDD